MKILRGWKLHDQGKPQYHSSAYGLHLVSDEPIPGLAPVAPSERGAPVITIQFRPNSLIGPQESAQGESLLYTSDIPDENGDPAMRIWRGNQAEDYRIRYSHGLEFRADRTVSFVSVHFLEASAREDVAGFLLGPVLGILLRLRGHTCLHASAADLEGRAVAFVGPEGAGKSTLAALFSRKGHAVLSDDIVALGECDGSFGALPGYPCLNLWPEAVEMVCWPRDGELPVRTNGDKIQLPLSAGKLQFQSTPLPLAAIYLLEKRSAQEEAPFSEKISPQDALMGLVANTYGNKLLDKNVRVQEFQFLARIVKQIPVRSVTAHEDPARLRRLYELICEESSSGAHKN